MDRGTEKGNRRKKMKYFSLLFFLLFWFNLYSEKISFVVRSASSMEKIFQNTFKE